MTKFKCPDCKDTGQILLLVQTVPCQCVAGREPKQRPVVQVGDIFIGGGNYFKVLAVGIETFDYQRCEEDGSLVPTATLYDNVSIAKLVENLDKGSVKRAS